MSLLRRVGLGLVSGVLALGTLAATAPAQAAPVEPVAAPVAVDAPSSGISYQAIGSYLLPHVYVDWAWITKVLAPWNEAFGPRICMQIYRVGPDGEPISTCAPYGGGMRYLPFGPLEGMQPLAG
jgi:hypothetical protein